MDPPGAGSATSLYLVRHAATQANVERRRAADDAPILAEARADAARLAERLRSLPLDALWSSPVLRARQTAEEVSAGLGLGVSFDPGLRDLECGPWTGLTEAEIANRFPDEAVVWNTSPSLMRLAGHETLAELQERVLRSLERIRGAHRSAVCVTHLGPIRVAVLHCTGKPLDHFGTVYADHCSIVRLSWSDQECRADWLE